MVRKNMQAGIISKISMLGADKSVIYALKNLDFDCYASKMSVYTDNKSDILGYGDRGVSCSWYMDQIRQYYNDLVDNDIGNIDTDGTYKEYIRLMRCTRLNDIKADDILKQVWGLMEKGCIEDTQISLNMGSARRDNLMAYILSPSHIIEMYMKVIKGYIGVLLNLDNGIESYEVSSKFNGYNIITNHRYFITVQICNNKIQSISIFRASDIDRRTEFYIEGINVIDKQGGESEIKNGKLTGLRVYRDYIDKDLVTELHYETIESIGSIKIKRKI